MSQNDDANESLESCYYGSVLAQYDDPCECPDADEEGEHAHLKFLVLRPQAYNSVPKSRGFAFVNLAITKEGRIDDVSVERAATLSDLLCRAIDTHHGYYYAKTIIKLFDSARESEAKKRSVTASEKVGG